MILLAIVGGLGVILIAVLTLIWLAWAERTDRDEGWFPFGRVSPDA